MAPRLQSLAHPVTGHGTAITHALASLRANTTLASAAAAATNASASAPKACFEVSSKKEADLSAVLKKAANRAIGGGVAGAAAMAINVSTLM